MRLGPTIVLIAALFATTPGAAAAPPLPWPDAAPAPGLPAQFAEQVMPPVVVSQPGMDRVIYHRNIRYTQSDDPEILMDIYRPPNSRAGERRGAVLFIHGGTDLRARPKDWGSYQSWGRLVAASGLVGVTFTHHLGFPQTRLDAGAADVAAAIDFVRRNAAQYGIDPDRICLAAFSAGGPMLARYMAGAPEHIRCLAGYYTFMDIRQSDVHRAAEQAPTIEAHSNILKVAPPGRKTPMLLVRAGKDEIPTLLDSQDRFVTAALNANYPLTLANHPEAPHGFENKLDDHRTHEIIEQTLDFFARHLEKR